MNTSFIHRYYIDKYPITQWRLCLGGSLLAIHLSKVSGTRLAEKRLIQTIASDVHSGLVPLNRRQSGCDTESTGWGSINVQGLWQPSYYPLVGRDRGVENGPTPWTADDTLTGRVQFE
jgi:hypothetical protein